MKNLLLSLILISSQAFAGSFGGSTVPPGTGVSAFIRNGSESLVIEDDVTPSNDRPLPVMIYPGQAPIPVSGTFTATNPSVGTTGSTSPTSATLVGGTNNSGNLTPLAITAAGALETDSSATTQPISAASLPLPSGASTSANQATIIANQTNGTQETQVTNFPASQNVVVTSSALPTGAATNSELTTINSTLGTPMQNSGGTVTVTQATAANLNATVTGTVSTIAPDNANSSLSSRQTVTGTESSVIAPTHAVGVIFECESVNADNLRWGFSNSATAILSSTLGILCEPGRDSGYLSLGSGNYLHLISTGSGSDYADVQWVLSQ